MLYYETSDGFSFASSTRGMKFGTNQSLYDWMFEDHGTRKTPDEYPYSYDAHYLWRDFDKDNPPPHDCVYTDRMQQEDFEKYKRAMDRDSTEFGTLGNLGSWGLRIQPRDAQIIAQRFWGKGTICIGYGLCCNVSNGYEIGIMLIKREDE